MSKPGDLTDEVLRHVISNVTIGKSSLSINAASAATVKTASAITYSNGGLALSKATLAVQALTPAAGKSFYAQPVSTVVYYVLALDASGAVTTWQGDFLGRLIPDGGQGRVGDGKVPDIPVNLTPFGMIKVTTNSVTTFTPGTTALDAAGLTVAFYDLVLLPIINP